MATQHHCLALQAALFAQWAKWFVWQQRKRLSQALGRRATLRICLTRWQQVLLQSAAITQAFKVRSHNICSIKHSPQAMCLVCSLVAAAVTKHEASNGALLLFGKFGKHACCFYHCWYVTSIAAVFYPATVLSERQQRFDLLASKEKRRFALTMSSLPCSRKARKMMFYYCFIASP